MSLRFWMSMALSLLVVTGCIYVSWVPQTVLPFDAQEVLGNPAQALVAPSSIGLPMPAGLRTGDVIDFESMAPYDRVMITNGGNPLPGEIVNLLVLRGGQTLKVPVAFVVDHKHGENLAIYLASLALTWLFAGLGLLLLWRGQRQAAWGVCLWCLVNVLAAVGMDLAIHEPLAGILSIASVDLLAFGSLISLYLLANDLTWAGIAPGTRRVMCRLFIIAFALYAVGEPIELYQTLVKGAASDDFRLFLILMHLCAFIVPMALLSLFYRRAPAAERVRIRWVWASILIYVASYVVNVSGNALPLDNLQLGLIINLLTAVAFLGFTYAVLRHRLVSLRLMLNRALVYGVITSLVVGVFAALSSLIEHFAMGKTEGALLQLLVPLSLGVALNLIKKRLDRFVERLFFQRQYRAEIALTCLVRECGFVANRKALLDRTVDELLEYLKPTGLALYEKKKSSYVLVRQKGERQFPSRLPEDDGAMVSLREKLSEADLDKLTSALGREGLAFPLAVRGTLIGALILGQRPAEHYTQVERVLLARIGQQVAASLLALRARDAENFVGAVARGSLSASPKTKSRARRLLQQSLAA